MKLFRVITKNFKLLIRSKASAFTVLVGPLLVILLVGLAFSTKTTTDLSIGYYAPAHNNLTNSFVDSLKQSKYYVQEFTDEQSCVRKIEQGIIHTCIIFPEDFKISNEQSKELRFLVDYSRINLVYKIIQSVSGTLNLESKELSYSLTQILLSRINATIKDLNQETMLLEGVNPKLNLLATDVQKARDNADAMKFDAGAISLQDLRSSVSSLNETFNSLQEKGMLLINDSEEWIDELSDHQNVSDIRDDFEKLRDEILELHNLTPKNIEQLEINLAVLSDSLLKIESELNTSKQLNKDTQARLGAVKTNLAGVQASLIELKSSLQKTKKNLESIGITSAESIVSPVNTRIEPIMLESSKLTFTFPFLIVLVIMFVALLLSSTLVIFEKSSKSFFRNHITPTKQEFFVITTFITSLIVIVIQTLIILGLANYFMYIPLFKNALASVIIILLTSALFIVLGMAVGYFFSTQEGAIMASIVLGSIFLFLSNLVVPLESFAPALTSIIKYNPFVLASELLRKSLLFNISLKEVLPPIIMLGGAALLIFLLVIISVSLKSKKRIRALKETKETRNAIILTEGGIEKEAHIHSRPEFKVGEQSATNIEGLLKLVSDMTKVEFEDQVNSQENKIAEWVEKGLGDKRLASKLRKTISRKEMINILAEEFKLEEKKEQSEQGE
jgi:ABC-type multidrug transport system permease subunit